MSEKTQEQIEADEEFEHALSRVLMAYELVPEDMVIVDFLISVEAQSLTDSTHEDYAHTMRGGGMRTSVALGLCELARKAILGNCDD